MAPNDNRKAAIKKLKLLVYNSKVNANVFRKKIEDEYYTSFLPNHVERSEHDYGGIKCDVLTPEIYSSKRILFYVHGGSFVGGSRASYRCFCSMLANKAYSRTVVPEYRLAPTYAFPSAVEDIQSSFRALFTEEQIQRSLDGDTDEEGNQINTMPEVIIAADGAGASIALSLILNLRERYRACIKKVVLFSPWLNLSAESPLITGKKGQDLVMTGEALGISGQVYTYSSNLENPLVSPLFAADEFLKGFPSVFIQMGKEEILVEDAIKFKERLEANGSECELDLWPDMPHLFQMAEEYLSDAHKALDKFSSVISGIDNQNVERQSFENKPILEHSLRAEA